MVFLLYCFGCIHFPGIQSAILMFPINLLIIAIFRNCKQRYTRCIYKCFLDTLKLHLLVQSEISGTTIAYLEGQGSSVYDRAALEESTKSLFNFSKKHKRHTAADYVEKDVEAGDNSVKMTSFSSRSFLQSGSSNMMSSGSKINTVIRDGMKEPTATSKSQPGLWLPWWFVYVAYFLVFVIVVACGFFTILYSFNYGLEVSVKWLTTLVLAFLTDALFTQPVKVVMLALAFSIIFKRSIVSQNVSGNVDFNSTLGEQWFLINYMDVFICV